MLRKGLVYFRRIRIEYGKRNLLRISTYKFDKNQGVDRFFVKYVDVLLGKQPDDTNIVRTGRKYLSKTHCGRIEKLVSLRLSNLNTEEIRHSEDYLALEDDLKNGMYNSLQWAALETCLLMLGFFELTAYCHERSLLEFLKETDGDLCLKRLGSLFELGRNDEFVREAKILLKNKHFEEYFEGSYQFVKACVNALEKKEDGDAKTLSNSFKDFITSKKLLLCGPSKTIDFETDADAIIRISDVKNEHIGKGIEGRKSDIVYLNGADTKKYANDLNLFENGAKHYAFKGRINIGERENVHSLFDCNDIFRVGALNMLQYILCDLLIHNKVDDVCVMGVNMYYGNIYKEGYEHIGVHDNNFDKWKSFALHNLILQFNFTKNMYELGFFSADEELDFVLTRQNAEYAKRVEDNFS